MKPFSILAVPLIVLVLFTATTPAMAQQSHVVQPGDTLASIARAYNVPLDRLATYNNITNWNIIYAGSILRIPPAGGTTETGTPVSTIRYVVKAGDTLSRIAAAHNTTVQAIKDANSLTGSVIYPNQGLWVPAGSYVPPRETGGTGATGGQYYWVRPGDNLFSIGMRFGVNIYRIAEANSLLNLNRIYAGVPLFIPR